MLPSIMLLPHSIVTSKCKIVLESIARSYLLYTIVWATPNMKSYRNMVSSGCKLLEVIKNFSLFYQQRKKFIHMQRVIRICTYNRIVLLNQLTRFMISELISEGKTGKTFIHQRIYNLLSIHLITYNVDLCEV